MVLPLMSVALKSGAGLPISTANAEAVNASAANKAKIFFIVQFSLFDDDQTNRRNSRVFGSKKIHFRRLLTPGFNRVAVRKREAKPFQRFLICLLYTSDAADEEDSVD